MINYAHYTPLKESFFSRERSEQDIKTLASGYALAEKKRILRRGNY